MDADLTCAHCEGAGDVALPRLGRVACGVCGGIGRRLPTLVEWGALRAERDRLLAERDAAHDARIEAQNPGIDMDEVRRRREEFGPAQDWTGRTAALDAKEGT